MKNGDKKRVLVIRLSSLGDILLTTPLIRSLHKLNYSVDFLLRPGYMDTVKYNPHIDRIFPFSNDTAGLLAELILNRYTAVIDLQNNLRSRRLTSRLNAPVYAFRKLSLRKFLLVRFKLNLLKYFPPSIPERYAESITGAAGFGNFTLDGEGLEVSVPDGVIPSLEEGKNYVALCPGSRHFTKQWPEEYYSELAELLVKKGYVPVLMGGKSDRDICRRISTGVAGSSDISNDDDLLQSAADMKRCLAVVCNDSGMMHLACASKIPVVAIFGSTVKEFGFIPYKNMNRVMEINDLKCRPCTHIGREKCPLGHFNCMRQLNPEAVLNSLLKLIEENPA